MKYCELKALRVKNGHTQEQLGTLMNMGKTTYCKKENGQIDFTLADIKLLKRVYSLSKEEIISIFFKDEVAFKTTKMI